MAEKVAPSEYRFSFSRDWKGTTQHCAAAHLGTLGRPTDHWLMDRSGGRTSSPRAIVLH